MRRTANSTNLLDLGPLISSTRKRGEPTGWFSAGRAKKTEREASPPRFLPKQPDYMPGLSSVEKKERLAKMSYDDCLSNFAKADKKVAWFYQNAPAAVFAVGTDATPALFCWEMGMPGFSGMKLDPTPDGTLADLPGGQHGRQNERNGGGEIHFPDGNATIARLLVRALIPEAVPGTTMDDVSTARVNYALLDRPGRSARIRLNSTAAHVKHDG